MGHLTLLGSVRPVLPISARCDAIRTRPRKNELDRALYTPKAKALPDPVQTQRLRLSVQAEVPLQPLDLRREPNVT